MKLKRIFITPPLAFARVGSAKTPCCAFSWSREEISPDKPAVTSLRIEETLTLDEDGIVFASLPREIVFREEDGKFRPVCPFFELWGVWEADGNEKEGPITLALLEEIGLSTTDITWEVKVANLKPYHVTLKESDRVTATAQLNGADSRKTPLFGKSPNVPDALVSHPEGIPMGEVQLSKPSDEFPEVRLRFYAPQGVLYGPPGLPERIAAISAAKPDLDKINAPWRDLHLPAERQRVNPASSWATHNFSNSLVPPYGAGDPRLNPGGLVAALAVNLTPSEGTVLESIGIVDDVGDGLITCKLLDLVAHARIAIGPQDFAPANRPVVSLQDGLSDRELRDDLRLDRLTDAELEEIVADIFERALETSDPMNKDAQNNRASRTNAGEYGGDLPTPGPSFESNPMGTLWPTINLNNPPPSQIGPNTVDAMPVTFLGQRAHRRYNALEYLRDRLREEPELIEKWIRPPRSAFHYYDRRMPALMRGSDRSSMHLTRRQYEILQHWAKRQAGSA